MEPIFAKFSASITELKRNPGTLINQAGKNVIAILKRNKPAAYLVPAETFESLLEQAASLDLAYLHVIRMPAGRVDNLALGQRYFGDRLIGNESYSFDEAQSAVSAGELTAVSFGRPFIANPDLVHRFRSGAPLSEFDLATLYTAGEEGYSSYPGMGA